METNFWRFEGWCVWVGRSLLMFQGVLAASIIRHSPWWWKITQVSRMPVEHRAIYPESNQTFTHDRPKTNLKGSDSISTSKISVTCNFSTQLKNNICPFFEFLYCIYVWEITRSVWLTKCEYYCRVCSKGYFFVKRIWSLLVQNWTR